MAELAEQAVSFADFGRAPHYQDLARRVQGQVMVVSGKQDDALRAFDAALAEFSAIGSRLEAARTLYHRATLRLARGDRDGGRGDAERARNAFAAMSASHDLVRAERLLQS